MPMYYGIIILLMKNYLLAQQVKLIIIYMLNRINKYI